jgi:hypothetical protein
VRQPPGGDRNTPATRTDADLLAEVACPRCGHVGSLTVRWRMGGPALAGESAAGRGVPTLVCGVEGCGFVEWPSGWVEKDP